MENYTDFEKVQNIGVGDKVPELVIKVYDTVEKKVQRNKYI